MTRTLKAILAVLVLGLAACGGGESVGSDELLDFDEKAGERIGGIDRQEDPGPTSTSAPATSVAPATTTPTTRPTTTSSPPTTARPAPAFTVKIVGGGQGFDPFNFAVKKGTRIRVENTDNQARTFTSDEAGAFDSGPIAPGAAFVYVAERVGKFNFHDETRPFAVGQMEVTP